MQADYLRSRKALSSEQENDVSRKNTLTPRLSPRDGGLTDPEKSSLSKSDAVDLVKFLYESISSCDSDIAQWNDDGISFTIKDADRFIHEVWGEVYQSQKFDSFKRQLNNYGFKFQKISLRDTDRDHFRFSNSQFQKGNVDALKNIQSCRNKKNLIQQKMQEDARTSAKKDAQKDQRINDLENKVFDLESHLSEMSHLVSSLLAEFQGTRYHLNHQDYVYNHGRSYSQFPLRDYKFQEGYHDRILLKYSPTQFCSNPDHLSDKFAPHSGPGCRDAGRKRKISDLKNTGASSAY